MQDANARAPSAPLDMYLRRQFLPLETCVLTADASPENRAWLAAHLDLPIEQTGRAELMTEIRRRHGAALLDQAIFGLARRFPELSAQRVLTRPQAVVLSTMVLGFLAATIFKPLQTWQVFVALMTVAFCVSGIFRALLTLLARRTISHPLSGLALPSYTILVPLYREAPCCPHWCAGLRRWIIPICWRKCHKKSESRRNTLAAWLRLEPLRFCAGRPRKSARPLSGMSNA